MLARPSTSLTSVFFKDSRKIVDFAGRGAATEQSCKQANACLLKAKFAILKITIDFSTALAQNRGFCAKEEAQCFKAEM